MEVKITWIITVAPPKSFPEVGLVYGNGGHSQLRLDDRIENQSDSPSARTPDTPPQMKYLALLSGGKDSCYNLLHCFKNGHELIAAASLGPAPGKGEKRHLFRIFYVRLVSIEEIDSYLYQTVGQDAIELVASALGVPLYRRVITGSAIEQGSEYGARSRIVAVDGDETEDLYELLLNVKVHKQFFLVLSCLMIRADFAP